MKDLHLICDDDIYKAKLIKGDSVDNVYVDAAKIKHAGLFRHALKYAFFVVKEGGEIVIKDSPSADLSLNPGNIAFWQIKQQVFKCLTNQVLTIEIDEVLGVIKLKKITNPYHYNGITFGIIFSGSSAEEVKLFECIDSIVSSPNPVLGQQILVSGPSAYNPSVLLNKYEGININYLPYDIPAQGRLLICEKKNDLFKNASYDLVVICHTRILFPKNFSVSLPNYMIDMATTQIVFDDGEAKQKYLDIGFIENYGVVDGRTTEKTIAGVYIPADYLKLYKKYYAYIDGGLNIFNKKAIKTPPYNNFIAWGEAEDIDICASLYQKGFLIDYLPLIECKSSTNKTNFKDSFLKKMYRNLYIKLKA